MNDSQRAFVLELAGGTRLAAMTRVQGLWDGYGEILRVTLAGGPRDTVIVKWVRPPPARGGDDDASRKRKCRSYDVESTFYRTVAAACDDTCRVATCLGQSRAGGEWLFVFEDLDAAGFPQRERAPRGAAFEACLAWLAAFHARFVGRVPEGLWKVGTYWHLATRQGELAIAARRDPALPERARSLDRQLSEARYQTLVHGDAKPANFCFTRDRRSVAAVDFQYVGGGPGIRDVAYFLHGERAPTRALDLYFAHLLPRLPTTIDGSALEREWRELFPVAVADFDRFLAGWQG